MRVLRYNSTKVVVSMAVKKKIRGVLASASLLLSFVEILSSCTRSCLTHDWRTNCLVSMYCVIFIGLPELAIAMAPWLSLYIIIA